MRSLRFSDEHRTGLDEVVTVETIELTTEILCKQKSACCDSELNSPEIHEGFNFQHMFDTGTFSVPRKKTADA